MRRDVTLVVLLAASTLTRSSGADLSVDFVNRVVRSHAVDLRACWLAAHDDTLEGVVTMEWTITLDGRVEHPTVARSTLRSAKVERCLTSEVATWRFGSAGYPVSVTYPFTFRR